MHFSIAWRLSRLSVFILIPAALGLASCGAGGGGEGGGDSGPTTDPAGSMALVEEGVGDLQELVTTLGGETPPPYSTIADVSDKFVEATQLDPANPDAAFFGALGKILLLVDSEDGKAFLAKLGWAEFRVNEQDFQDFIAGVSGGFSSLTCGEETCEEFVAPVKDPETWQLGQDGNLTIAELIQFVTVTLPTHLRSASNLLGTIPSTWSYELTLEIPGEGEEEPEVVTIEIDYTDAMALRAVLSGLEAGLAAPGIWTYTGIDAFMAARPEVEEPAELNAAIYAYFNDTGLAPLSNNQVGVERVGTALLNFLDSFDKAIGALRAESDDQANDLLSTAGVFVTGQQRYDAEATVINYGLDAYRLTAADLKASITAAGPIRVYQPVAFMTGFNTCDPLAASTTDYDLAVEPRPDQNGIAAADLVNHVEITVFDGTPVSPTDAHTDGNRWFRIDLEAPTDLSIWATSEDNTTGSIAYEDGEGNLVAWDSDANSYDGSNFGMSIAADYFLETYQGLPAMNATFPLTLWVRVEGANGEFQLRVKSSPEGTQTEPIFLKGGGGRLFQPSRYKIAEVPNAKIGEAVKVAGKLFDLSNRMSLVMNMATGEEEVEGGGFSIPITSLLYGTTGLRASLSSILPQLSFGSPLSEPEPVDVFNLESEPNWLSGITNLEEQVVLPESPELDDAGTELGEFCAYPGDLMPATLFPGARSIGIGF